MLGIERLKEELFFGLHPISEVKNLLKLRPWISQRGRINTPEKHYSFLHRRSLFTQKLTCQHKLLMRAGANI